MAKGNGLSDLLFVDGYDLSGDIGSVSELASPSSVLDVTGINATGHERLLGNFDGMLNFAPWFNDAASQEHAVLKVFSADRIVSYFHGSAIGNMSASIVAKQFTYGLNRTNDGGLAGTVSCQGNGSGLEFGGPGGTLVAKDGQLTAGKRTDTGATNGVSLDSGIVGGTALGISAVLQVFSFTGTDATASIQSSSDDGGGDAYANITGGVFTQITTAPVAQRIVTSLTQAVERYLRVATVTTGGFSSLVFAVSHSRYPYQG